MAVPAWGKRPTELVDFIEVNATGKDEQGTNRFVLAWLYLLASFFLILFPLFIPSKFRVHSCIFAVKTKKGVKA